jgi:hypothetical protein
MSGKNPVRQQGIGGKATKGGGISKKKDNKGGTVGSLFKKAGTEEEEEEEGDGDGMLTDQLEREQKRQGKMDKIKAEALEEALGLSNVSESQQSPPAAETVSL